MAVYKEVWLGLCLVGLIACSSSVSGGGDQQTGGDASSGGSPGGVGGLGGATGGTPIGGTGAVGGGPFGNGEMPAGGSAAITEWVEEVCDNAADDGCPPLEPYGAGIGTCTLATVNVVPASGECLDPMERDVCVFAPAFVGATSICFKSCPEKPEAYNRTVYRLLDNGEAEVAHGSSPACNHPASITPGFQECEANNPLPACQCACTW